MPLCAQETRFSFSPKVVIGVDSLSKKYLQNTLGKPTWL